MPQVNENISRVSVVIPCYKQASYLATAIESVLCQTVPGIEIIVVDDGSPDATADVAGRYGQKVSLIRQPNSGVAAARNAGLARAKGEYVLFLDADDFLLPTAVENHLRGMESHAADITCGAWRVVDAEGVTLSEFPAPEFKPDPFHALLPVNLCPPVCYLFKRSILTAIGNFDPDRRKSGHEDWDLLLRLSAAGVKFVSLPQTVAAYRSHSNSASSRYLKMYDSGLSVLSKARRAHPRCPTCGDRFEMAYQRFFDEYLSVLLFPKLTDHPLSPRHWAAWKDFLKRSIDHPSLATTAASRLLRAMARRC